MKKTLSILMILALVAGAAWVGSAWWFGRQTESQYRQMVAKASNLGSVKVQIESYRRGLFGATVRTRIALPVPVAKVRSPLPPLNVTVVSRITPGPFPGGAAGWHPAMALVRSRVTLGPGILKLLRRAWPAFPEELPVTSTTVVYLGGNGESWTSAAPIHRSLDKPEAMTVDWQGLRGHATFSADFKKCRGTWNMPALKVTGKTVRLQMAGLEGAFNLHLPNGLFGLVLGDFNYGLKRLEFAAEGAKKDKNLKVDLRDLAFKGSNWEVGGAVNGALRASFGKLALDGSVNGPGILDLQMTNLDASALQEIQQTSRRLEKERSKLSPREFQAQMAAAMGKLWPRLAARSPALEVRELSFEGPDGHLRCSGKVAVDGSKKEALASPLLLPQALSARASLDVSAPLLRKAMGALVRQKLVKARAASGQPPLSKKQLDALLAGAGAKAVASLVEKHILVPKGDAYTLTASYRPGEAILNGRPLPLH